MSNRIGPQMLAATAYVSRHPGCAIRPVAAFLHVGAATGKNNALGYNPVHRAIDAGLIDATIHRGRYTLMVSSRGLEILGD